MVEKRIKTFMAKHQPRDPQPTQKKDPSNQNGNGRKGKFNSKYESRKKRFGDGGEPDDRGSRQSGGDRKRKKPSTDLKHLMPDDGVIFFDCGSKQRTRGDPSCTQQGWLTKQIADLKNKRNRENGDDEEVFFRRRGAKRRNK